MCEAREPGLAPRLAGAIDAPGEAQVDPVAVVAALVRALERAGVQILRLELLDLKLVLEALAGQGLHRILVEGGGEVHASVLEERLADEACVFVAPKIVGGRDAKTPVEGEGSARMADALLLDRIQVERFDDDLMIRGRFVR